MFEGSNNILRIRYIPWQYTEDILRIYWGYATYWGYTEDILRIRHIPWQEKKLSSMSRWKVLRVDFWDVKHPLRCMTTTCQNLIMIMINPKPGIVLLVDNKVVVETSLWVTWVISPPPKWIFEDAILIRWLNIGWEGGRHCEDALSEVLTPHHNTKGSANKGHPRS